MMNDRRWIKYYSSADDILLVGEGDFSFSLSLGTAFSNSSKIVATSLDTYEELLQKYKNAMKNVVFLGILGAFVLHGVDAARMRTHPHLQFKKFDYIVYNFPHAGFCLREDNPDMLRMHRDLVRGFLLNASCMLHFDGEIHIRHKSNATFDRWKIEDLGLECSLVCIAQDEFRIEEFPGYNNKRGSSSRADEPFPLGPCKTYRFRLISSWMFHLMRQMHPVPSSFASQMFPNPPPRPLVPQHQPLITTVDDHGSARGYCTCWDCRTRRDSSTKQRQMHPSASRMFPNPPPITTVGDHGAARRYYASECCCGSWDCRTSRDSSTKRHQMHSVPPFASQMFPNPPPLVQQHQPPITTVDDHGAARQYYASECLCWDCRTTRDTSTKRRRLG
ncbi:heavy metal-associated isoprenylated plant protein 41-like isoform X1 [Salvia splendens]|uniref:heavy metal-associated isoprenylated plant protein 41-like isoform X1 n=1 Tax=Salvia splendens TaxID=180675 RepID=UPI001C252292|nr:heavy metal-associated isoprenylated plant protein 41-like isoform X1 [Salvia splendens]